MCAPPIIHYLSGHGFRVTVANRTVANAEKITSGLPNVSVAQLDIEAENAAEVMDELIPQCDLVVSLLPYLHHCKAARIAIKHKKHFCTTSYVSDEMASLGPAALEAGVILLNELGVDPGLDLASAQKIIDDAHAHGGKIHSFYSICGGLPAPEDNNNPLGYKLSWAPRGVLLAARNNAEFMENGEIVKIPSKNLFLDGKHSDFVKPVGALEWYPNRDSVKFIEHHKIPETKTIVRGTYRYPGWCRMMKAVADVQLHSIDKCAVPITGMTYANFLLTVLLPSPDFNGVVSSAAAKARFASFLGLAEDDNVVYRYEWLGLFSDSDTIPAKIDCPVDVLCSLWLKRLQYDSHERDMLVMKHTFEIVYRPADRRVIESRMINIGWQDKGSFSSMSRTVSLPVAAASRMVLEGRLKLRGLTRPVVPELYNPILEEMHELGVVFDEEEMKPHFWMRHEVKPGEERVVLVPSDVKMLLDAGFKITVEKSPTRCIPDAEYVAVGATLAETGSWEKAPYSAIILGLKELPEADTPLIHRHIYFAHCYKNQGGWKELLHRFISGEGMLWDLEFLNDDTGRRIAAFGRAAGIAGMAAAILAWVHQQVHPGADAPALPALTSYASLDAMVSAVKAKVQAVGGNPKCMCIGAKGRVGGGATWFAQQCGLTVTEWDMAETAGGGPFPQCLEHEIVANCIYLTSKINPFVTLEMLGAPGRKLSVLTDIACDVTNPNNPLPIYDRLTSLVEPCLRVVQPSAGVLPMDVISIDHLPTLIPNDSSAEFSKALAPHLLNLVSVETPVFRRAEELFVSKCAASRA